MDGLDGLKQWKCGHGHVLGVVRRMPVSINGSMYHATRLILFREAIDEAEDTRADVDVIAVIEGTTLDVRCSVCGATRTWWMGEAAIKRLMERMGLELKTTNRLGEGAPKRFVQKCQNQYIEQAFYDIILIC